MRQRSGLQSLSDDASSPPPSPTGDPGDTFPPTYYVMQFNHTVKSETVRWIVSKICATRQQHGAELLVRKQDNSEDPEQVS